MSGCRKNNPDSKPLQLPLIPETFEIRLTKGQIAIVSPEDAELASVSWHAVRTKSGRYYAMSNGRYLHRAVMIRMTGRFITGNEEVDHIDRDGLNCLRSNLRFATPAQNRVNQSIRSDNKTGYTGVRQCNGKWRGELKIKRKKPMYTDLYDTAELAYEAYCELARSIYGEYFNDNKPLLSR